MIEIENVTKIFGETRVLDDVSLTLPEGRLTALIGPNGAGKTTLLNVIGRLEPMSAGRVRVGGDDVARADTTALAKRLSVLAQEHRISARLTVREVVGFGRWPHCRGRMTPADRQVVDSAMARLGVADLADRWLDTLSGGQRQRAYIAMTLAQDAPYALFDEPLNSLDVRHAREVMRVLRGFVDELGRTVAVVLHDINAAAAYADHVVALRAGRVVEAGAPQDVINADVLRRVYDVDLPVERRDGRSVADYWDRRNDASSIS